MAKREKPLRRDRSVPSPPSPAVAITGPAWRWPVGLYLGALLLRLAHLLSVRDSPFFLYLGLDPLAYHEWALRLAAGDWLGDRIFYQDPLYPYFLGALYAVLGDGRLAVTAIQLALGALIPVLLWDATRVTLGRRAAAVTGVLAAAYLPAVYYEGLILKTWLGALLVAIALWCLARALAPGARSAWWAGAGLALGLGCLVRGNLLLVLPALAAWRLLERDAEPGAGPPPFRQRRRWRQVAALLAGAACVLGLTALRNRAVGGEWVLTTAQGGQNFYLGNNPLNTSGRYDPLPWVGANPKYEEKGFAAEARRRTGRDMRPTEISRYWLAEARSWILRHPGDWLALTWRKLRTYWGAYEVPDNLDIALYRRDAPILRLPLAGFGLVAPLGLAGLLMLAGRPGWPRALLLFTIIYSGSVVLFFVFSRYRLPMVPALLPPAGWLLAELWRRRRDGWRAWRIPAALLVAAALWVHIPVHAATGSLAYRIAGTLGLPRRAESTATGHYNLGLAFAQYAEEERDSEAMLRRAVAAFRDSAAEEPGRPEPWAEMGKALARLGENEEAIAAYRRVIALDPGRARPHHVLGILYRRTGDRPAASDMFARALALQPGRLDSAVALGEVQLERGLRDEAVAAFRHALKLQPDSPEARAGLARAQAGR